MVPPSVGWTLLYQLTVFSLRCAISKSSVVTLGCVKLTTKTKTGTLTISQNSRAHEPRSFVHVMKEDLLLWATLWFYRILPNTFAYLTYKNNTLHMYKISNNSLNILYLCIPIPAFTWISWRRGGSFPFEETPWAPFPHKSLMRLLHGWTEQDSLLPPCSPLFQWALGCRVLKQCQRGESEDKADHTWVMTWQSHWLMSCLSSLWFWGTV